MNVSLTPELKKFVQKEVKSGLYQTASEVIRAGLRRLKKDEARHPCEIPGTLEELEANIQKSIDSLDRGEGIDGKEMFRQLRERAKRARRRG